VLFWPPMLARRLGPVKPLPPAIFLLGALLASGAAAQVADPETALRELRRQESAPHPRSEPEESFRLTEIGREYLRREDIPRAIELLSEAAARDSENRSALIHLTLAYLRHGDLEFAEFYFSQSLQQEPSRGEDAETYLRLGDIYEQLNRLPEAIAAWQEVRRLGDKTPGLAAKLERSKVSWAYSHGQRFFGGELFDLYYDPEISAETAELADSFLEKEWLTQATFFGAQLPGHPIVILYAGRRYFHLLDTPDWVGGYYDGRIHVPIDSGSPLGEATFGLLRHELAHAYLHRLSRGRAPAWLQEGLAQYVEGRRTDRRELQRIGARPGGFLESSTDAFHQRTDRDHARRAYALALSFVEFLARRGGPESAVCLAYSLGAGKTIDAACEESFGEPLSGLERQWIASLG
jgi:tetratricopeptide (TPR) repeat protein